MNAETLDLIQRPYGEIVDDLLTAVVGGVVNEPLFFDVKNSRYPLAEPSIGIRGATGTFEKKHTQFQLEVDFTFSEADNALIWREEGRHPDDESIFFVDYFRRFSDSPITDINVGSVVRTINEAAAREVAFVYQQINQVYLSAFIDTATGKSLDLVVSILGVVRKSSEFAEGLVTFFRDPAAGDGNISIPEGALLRTNKGEATFATAQLRTLQRGQVRIDVPVRATEASKGPDGLVAAGLINTLVQPITGIARITNFDGTILGEKDESDEELRARAKAAVRSLGKATLAAIQRVIAEERAALVDIYDPNLEDKRSDPGTITALVEVTPGRFASLRNAVEDTRAAGVRAFVLAQQIFVKPRLIVTLRTAGLTKEGGLKVRREIVEALGAYLDSLKTAKPILSVNKTPNPDDNQEVPDLVSAVKSVEEVETVSIPDVIVRRLDLSKLPGASLLPARDLILNEAGGPVADADFGEDPKFQIITDATAPAEWFFVLDMDPEADIEIQGEAA